MTSGGSSDRSWRRLYLVRHGATDYGGSEGEGALPGRHLTAAGRSQAQALARLMRAIEIDLIASSPLGRARETAAILAEGREGEIELVSALEEISPGDLGTMDLAEIFRAVRGFFADPETTWDMPYLGGETYRQLRARVVEVMERIMARPNWRRALVVAHGGVNNALLGWALGLEGPRLPAIEQDFGCLNMIDFLGSRPVVRLVNFTAYDPLKAGLECSSLEVMWQVLEASFGIGLMGGEDKS